ncbi:MAG: hypothetical protein AAB288_04450, partial [Acidobacteriota bacterium]
VHPHLGVSTGGVFIFKGWKPFLIAAAFASDFIRWSAGLRARLGAVEKAMGAFLVVAGILIFTGQMPTIANWLIEQFPAHPHEGGVGAPDNNPAAAVVATGTSKATKRPFNLIVAFDNSFDDNGNNCGRAIAESSFHHLVDYNWNIDMGCPSFLEESPGDGIKSEPEKLDDIRQYVANAAKWLSRS